MSSLKHNPQALGKLTQNELQVGGNEEPCSLIRGFFQGKSHMGSAASRIPSFPSVSKVRLSQMAQSPVSKRKLATGSWLFPMNSQEGDYFLYLPAIHTSSTSQTPATSRVSKKLGFRQDRIDVVE
jgi:hypothetical protein